MQVPSADPFGFAARARRAFDGGHFFLRDAKHFGKLMRRLRIGMEEQTAEGVPLFKKECAAAALTSDGSPLLSDSATFDECC